MTEVRTRGDYEQWVKFFLRAVVESAEDAVVTIDELAALHDMNFAIVKAMGRGEGSAARVLAYLERNPIITVKETAGVLNMSFNAVSAAVKRLCEADILKQEGTARRGRVFHYRKYLDILRRGT